MAKATLVGADQKRTRGFAACPIHATLVGADQKRTRGFAACPIHAAVTQARLEPALAIG